MNLNFLLSLQRGKNSSMYPHCSIILCSWVLKTLGSTIQLECPTTARAQDVYFLSLSVFSFPFSYILRSNNHDFLFLKLCSLCIKAFIFVVPSAQNASAKYLHGSTSSYSRFQLEYNLSTYIFPVHLTSITVIVLSHIFLF